MHFQNNQIVNISSINNNGPVNCVAYFLLNQLKSDSLEADSQDTLLQILNDHYGSNLSAAELTPFLKSLFQTHPLEAIHFLSDAILELPEVKKHKRHTNDKLLDSQVFTDLTKLFRFNFIPHFNDSSADLDDNGVQRADAHEKINLNPDDLQAIKNINYKANLNAYYLGAARGKHLYFNLLVDEADAQFALRFNESLPIPHNLKAKSEERLAEFQAKINQYQASKESKYSRLSAATSSLSSSTYSSSSPSPAPSSEDAITMSLESSDRVASNPSTNPRNFLFTEPAEESHFESTYQFFASEAAALSEGADHAPLPDRTGPVCLATHKFPEQVHDNEFQLKEFKILQSNKTARSLHSRLVLHTTAETLLENKADFNVIPIGDRNILLAMVDKQINDGRSSLHGSGRVVISINNKPGSPMKPLLQQAYYHYCLAMGITLKDISAPIVSRTLTSKLMTDNDADLPAKAAALKTQIDSYRNNLNDWTKAKTEAFEL